MKKKNIIAILLVFIVLLLGGASIYVATQLSSEKAIAPTAPESEPAAYVPEEVSDISTTSEWVGSEACAVTGTATEVVVDTKLSVVKRAMTYVDDASKTEGYVIKTDTDTATREATFVYWIQVTNTGNDPVNGIVLTDTLNGTNQDKLTFIDVPSNQGCSYDSASRKLTCNPFNLTVGQKVEKSFRVKVTGDFPTASTISNTAIATVGQAVFQGFNTLKVAAPPVEPVTITMSGGKTAYKNEAANTAGVYTLTSEMNTVSKDQIYVYTLTVTNTSTATATGVVIKDSLKDMPVTYMDTVAGCTWNATSVELTCNTTVNPSETKKFSFRVKASDSIANGTVITNTGIVTFPGGTMELKKDLTVSTVVGCNNTCTTDAECSTGLSCDTTSNKCRVLACTAEEDCTCPVAVVPTVIVTSVPVVVTQATTAPTQAVTAGVTAAPTPTILPETGIFDLPGIAAFGGGLLLAVIGILLAL